MPLLLAVAAAGSVLLRAWLPRHAARRSMTWPWSRGSCLQLATPVWSSPCRAWSSPYLKLATLAWLAAQLHACTSLPAACRHWRPRLAWGRQWRPRCRATRGAVGTEGRRRRGDDGAGGCRKGGKRRVREASGWVLSKGEGKDTLMGFLGLLWTTLLMGFLGSLWTTLF